MTHTKTLKKAIIPAAGRGTRQFPASRAVRKEFFPIIDVDGVTRCGMQFIVAEALSADIEEICVVVSPGEEEFYRSYFRGLTPEEERQYASKPWILKEAEILKDMGERLSFRTQHEQLGLGHSVWCARDFAGGDPVMILLGDHLYLSNQPESCAKQAADAWKHADGSVSSVRAVTEEHLHLFGVIRTESNDGPPWRVAEIFEKPEVEFARQHLQHPEGGQNPYLVFFGIHVMDADVFDCLDEMIASDTKDKGEYQLTVAQSMLASRGNYWAAPVDGVTYDIGVPHGLAATQAAMTAVGPFRKDAEASIAGLPERYSKSVV